MIVAWLKGLMGTAGGPQPRACLDFSRAPYVRAFFVRRADLASRASLFARRLPYVGSGQRTEPTSHRAAQREPAW